MTTQNLNVLKVLNDERFAHVMPELSAQEFANLTVSLRENGCLSPIIIWDNTIIDGHSRYKICREYNIPFTTKEISFNNDAEAIAWIVEFHVARRNLSRFQRCELVLRYEAEIKVNVEKRRRAAISQYQKTGIKAGRANKDTLSILADMADVSRRTLARAKRILEIGDEETKRRLRAGEISIYYAYMNLMAHNLDSVRATEDAEDLVKLYNGTENTASEVSEVKVSENTESVTAVPADDPKSVLISDINVSVKRLIELVEAGDATTNTILKELKSLLDMTRTGTGATMGAGTEK